ncbi:T9SS type A sorting domain-containing protein [Chitinophaga dinghuensis]|uniref:T9SS type A sorting domain-containing protein n=1 Tax=Chitinophaga dinghuensis TaxID=1539050 RepID=UPI0037445D1D
MASTPNDGSESVTIPNTPTTNARIKVEAVGNIFFDISNVDFTITAGSACASPSGLSSSSITATTATIGWTAVSGATSYDVDYKATTSSTWINAATATSSVSAGLTGLAANTTYDYRVRSNCASGSSTYSAGQFLTPSPGGCFAPTGLNSTSITSSGATVTWTAVSGAAGYDVDYKANSASTWINAVTGTTSTSVNLTGLSALTLYNWRVRTRCSDTSTYASSQFTTASAGCASPLDTATNNTIAGAATIPFNTDVTGLISPSGDIDNYKFVITTGGTITITLGTLPADYDLKLLNSAGTQLAISQNGGTTSESISRTMTPGTYYAQVYGYSGANSATQCYTLRVQLGTASKTTERSSSEEAQSIQAFPNPANNVLNINLTGYKGKSEVNITDINGRVVLRRMVSTTLSQVDISSLQAGVYVISIKNRDGSVTMTKFIKQ